MLSSVDTKLQIKSVQGVSELLGPRSDEFLVNSEAMLDRANDHYQNGKKSR